MSDERAHPGECLSRSGTSALGPSAARARRAGDPTSRSGLTAPGSKFGPAISSGEVRRRYAILDDNDRLLDERLRRLARALPSLARPRVVAANVIGSVAEGRARDGSDIDLVLILGEGSPERGDYSWWDRDVEPRLASDGGRFPVQPLFVARAALDTREPHLAAALRGGIPLWDPEGLFSDQSETGT